MTHRLPAALMAGLLAAPAAAADRGFLNKVYKAPDGTESKYVVFVPHDYAGDTPYPTILFLHGAGETGSDGVKQSQVGIGEAVKKREKTFPFIVVMPQASDRTVQVGRRWYADSPDGRRALAVLKEVESEFKVDPKRVYLTGLSMGGFGTWNMAFKHPDKWAAIVPVCGGGDPKAAAAIKDLPCWCFHGDADKAVPVKLSRDMVEALKAAGGSPRYTEYPKVGHKSWEPAYDTDELYAWLLTHKKP